MSDTTVSNEKIQIAREFGLVNVEQAAGACRAAGLPFWAACALLQMESMGHNVWGRADQSHFAGYPGPVTEQSFRLFLWLVTERGLTPTGVGPCQITYAGELKVSLDGRRHRDGGYFRVMAEGDLRPWNPTDNMRFGFGLLAGHYADSLTWEAAGTAYNGSTDYGADLVEKCNEWRERFGMKADVE